ncbi:MAG: glycosyltransferase family 4 protein [Chloroflexi bacterium]|nr:glycosyltransferase family 4 protein [Chloroflexota bacterium]
MRIGVNALAVSPERPGGDVTYVLEMVRRCPSISPNLEWVVFETPWAQKLIGELPSNTRRVVCRIPHRSLPARALWEQAVLPRLAERERLDVLFAPVNVAPATYRGRVVLTLHEAEPFMPSNAIPGPLVLWWRVLRGISARRADRILTVTEFARQELVRWMGLPGERIAVVHLGVDVDRFTNASAFPTRTLGQPYVLWVGRPYPRKGLDTLLSAFAALRGRGRPERLVLVGPPGWNEAFIQQRIAREFRGGAVVRVPAMWGELASWYAGAAVFAFPSIYETFGLPVLEAMAAGSPVVASDIPALREVAGDAAVYAKPADAAALAQSLTCVLDDSDLRGRLRKRGLARAMAFEWHVTAQRTLEHLVNVAGRRVPR